MGLSGCGANLMGTYGVVVAAVWTYWDLLRIRVVIVAAVLDLWADSMGL